MHRRTIFLLAVLAAVLWVGYLARGVVTPLVAALLLAYVLDPVARRLQRLGLSRSAASGAIVGAVLALVLGVAAWSGTRMAQEAGRFYEEIAGEPAVLARSPAEAKSALAEFVRSNPDVRVLRAGGDVAPAAPDSQSQWFADLDGDQAFDEGLARRTGRAVEDLLKRNNWTAKLAQPAALAADFAPQLAANAGKWVQGLLDQGGNAAGTALQILTLVLLFPIYLYFSLLQLDRVFDVVVRHLPAAQRDRVVEILSKIHFTLAQFFRGRLILFAIRLAALVALFLAFQVPFALPCALFGAVASFVPVLGSIASIAVGLALALAGGSGSGALIALLCLMVAIEAVEQYVLTPMIVGKRLGLHPLTILLATFIAGDLLGIFGMLVAIPLAAVLKVLFVEFVLPEIRRQAGIPVEGDAPPAGNSPRS